MAEFLVEIEIALPPDMPDERRAALQQDERAAGEALVRDGTIVRIWRVPGRTANVGIWSAPDATALHGALQALPMAPWMDVRVRPLATHPLEADRARRDP